MKFNWKDPFGKKRIKGLEIENSKLRKDYDNLKEFYNEQVRYTSLRKKFDVRKYMAETLAIDRFSDLEPDQVEDYVKNELAIMLGHALKKEISYSWGWDDATGCRTCTATIEVLGERR